MLSYIIAERERERERGEREREREKSNVIGGGESN